MRKRVAMAIGVALTAVSIILTAFGATPASDMVREPKIMVIVAFVFLGTVMQVYGAWPRRRSRYFTDEILEDGPSPWRPATSEPKAAPSSRRRRQPASVHSPQLADSNEAAKSH
jgi:hypothetical protein